MTARRTRLFLGILTSSVIICGVITYASLFSAETRLKRELIEYAQSVALENPRPDRLKQLSPASIPILLKWLQQHDIQTTFSDRIINFVNSATRRLGTAELDFRSSTDFEPYPPTLALTGFGFLGSNAAPALPKLKEIILEGRSAGEYPFIAARSAVIAIGNPAFNIASDLCRDPTPVAREAGAYILGALQTNPNQTVPILLRLLDDPSILVRSEAYSALAEFPSAGNESILIRRLEDIPGNEFLDAAYALHTGSTNALLHLVDFCAKSSDRNVRSSILAALATRDVPRTEPKEKEEAYLHRHNRCLLRYAALKATMHDNVFESLLPMVRSNIAAGRGPQLVETIKSLHPELVTNSPAFRMLDDSL